MATRSPPRLSSSFTEMERLVAGDALSTAMSCELESSSWKTTSLSPSAMRSPLRSGAGSMTFMPLSIVPLTLPQSRTYQRPRSSATSACRRERKRSLIGTVHSDARPSVISPSPLSITCCGARPG